MAKKKTEISASQIIAVVLAFATISLYFGFNPVTGITSNGAKTYTIDGTADISGKVLAPHIDIENVGYTVKEAGFFDYSIAPMSFYNAAEDVQCTAMAISGNTIVKASSTKGMGNFAYLVGGTKQFAYSIAKIPAGSYTLRVECKDAAGDVAQKDSEIIVG